MKRPPATRLSVAPLVSPGLPARASENIPTRIPRTAGMLSAGIIGQLPHESE